MYTLLFYLQKTHDLHNYTQFSNLFSVLKANLDTLLVVNEEAPELEKIAREEIVLDIELRNSIIQVCVSVRACVCPYVCPCVCLSICVLPSFRKNKFSTKGAGHVCPCVFPSVHLCPSVFTPHEQIVLDMAFNYTHPTVCLYASLSLSLSLSVS
jgi:hypothetical protein